MNKKELIEFFKNATETDKRENGEEFIKFREGVFEQIKDILFKGDFEIDDFYYETISEAFYNIAWWLEEEENNQLEDFEVFEYAEADIYTADLYKWLMCKNSEYYCDEALREYQPLDFIQLLQYAQSSHKQEIYGIALVIAQDLLKEVE